MKSNIILLYLIIIIYNNVNIKLKSLKKMLDIDKIIENKELNINKNKLLCGKLCGKLIVIHIND